MINTLDFLGITNKEKYCRFAEVIILPTYKKYLGLHYLLENYNFASISLLTNFCFTTSGINRNEPEIESTKFGSYIHSYINDAFKILNHSSAFPLTKYKIQNEQKNFIKEALSEGALEKLKRPTPIVLQVNDMKIRDHPQIFLSGNEPLDQMVLERYSFSVFQVPHHKQGPKLAAEVYRHFPSHELLENAAKLVALYNYKHVLGAEINLLEDDHPLYETAKTFRSYFMKRVGKIEKGFKKMFLTHTRLPNDPDDCYEMDNPQILWYEQSSKEVFSDETMKAVENETNRQVEEIQFLCECVEWAYHYKQISTELYMVSAGNDYNKIALQTIIGIMIACKWKDTPCKFAFTNNGWLKHIGEVLPKTVREYVHTNTHVWFLNDVCRNDYGLDSKPFFTIDLCNNSATDEDNSDRDQHPVIKIDASSRAVEVKGMNVYKLEDIRNEDDHTNMASLISASLKIAISKKPMRHSDRIHTEKCFLGRFLEYIGYPNPSEPIKMRDVMKCLVGDLLVSQMMNLHADQSDYFEIIPKLLNSKAKGISEFKLNLTKTASILAKVFVYMSNTSSVKVSNNKLLSACFEIINAKASNMKIILHLTFADNKCIPLDLVKHLNVDGSIGHTLAEYVAIYNYTGAVWRGAESLTVGETLHVLFKEDYALSVLKIIPLFLSAKINTCKIQHHFSYVKLDDENKIEEAHIHMESPGVLDSGNICLDIKSLSLHLYPCCAVIENSVQIRGAGLINEFEVEFNSCLSSYLPQDLDVKFIDFFAIEKAFDVLNLKVDSNVIKQCFKSKGIQNFTTHLIFSQLMPHSMTCEVKRLTFSDDFDNLKCSIPSQFSNITCASSYIAFHFPFRNDISHKVVDKSANFVFNPPLTSTSSITEGKSLNCSLYTESGKNLFVNMLPLYDHKNQNHLNGKVLSEVIKSVCSEKGCRLIKKMLQIPPIEENLNKIALCCASFI